MGFTAPLGVPSFASPVGAAKFVNFLPPPSPPPNPPPKTDPPKTPFFAAPVGPNEDGSEVPKPDDVLFANAPNPPLPAGSVFFVPVAVGSKFLELMVVSRAKGLGVVADVDEAPKVPNGEVAELASAAKPEEAKAAADV